MGKSFDFPIHYGIHLFRIDRSGFLNIHTAAQATPPRSHQNARMRNFCHQVKGFSTLTSRMLSTATESRTATVSRIILY